MSENEDECQCSRRLHCVTKTKDRSSDYYTDVTEWRQSRAPARDASQTHQFVLSALTVVSAWLVCRGAEVLGVGRPGKFARLHWPQGALRNGPSLHAEGIQRVKVCHFSQLHAGRSVGRVFTAKINKLCNNKLSFSTRNFIKLISILIHQRQLHVPVATVDMQYREHSTIIWILVQHVLKRVIIYFFYLTFYCSSFVCNI